jgi:opacity protein-like surface antigen
MLFKYKTTLFCLFLAANLSGQQALMLHSLPDLWHANSLNPAFFPEGKRIAVGLPAYTLDANHSGNVTYNDLFRQVDGNTVIDLGGAIEKLDPENKVRYDQRVETVSLGLRSKNDKWAFQFGHAIQQSGYVNYTKSLAQVLWNGNAPYLGETLEIGPKANIFDWHEWSVGVARRFGKVDIGVRGKFLTGAGLVRSDENQNYMSVYTDPDIYQLTLKTDYKFYSSSIVSAIDTAGLGFNIVSSSFGSKPSTENTGFALDFGLNAKLSENLSINASVLNLGGSITWKKDAASFTSVAEYTYEGATIPGLDIINGTDSLDFDAKLDTLNDIFQFEKQAATFDSELPLTVTAGAQFKLSEKWSLGFSAFYMRFEDETNTALGVSARWLPLRWLSLGAMYGANSRSASNLGFHVALMPGPVQVYFLSDNLLNVFSPNNSPAVNLRMGASVVF